MLFLGCPIFSTLEELTEWAGLSEDKNRPVPRRISLQYQYIETVEELGENSCRLRTVSGLDYFVPIGRKKLIESWLSDMQNAGRIASAGSGLLVPARG